VGGERKAYESKMVAAKLDEVRLSRSGIEGVTSPLAGEAQAA
jgi:hypothetical protein